MLYYYFKFGPAIVPSGQLDSFAIAIGVVTVGSNGEGDYCVKLRKLKNN